MRFAEIALLVSPFVVFVAWRLLAPAGGLPRVFVLAVTGTVVVMAGLLLGFWYEEAESPGTGYVPAQLQGGQVVPEHVVPVAPGQVVPVAPDQTISPSSAGHPGSG